MNDLLNSISDSAKSNFQELEHKELPGILKERVNEELPTDILEQILDILKTNMPVSTDRALNASFHLNINNGVVLTVTFECQAQWHVNSIGITAFAGDDYFEIIRDGNIRWANWFPPKTHGQPGDTFKPPMQINYQGVIRITNSTGAAHLYDCQIDGWQRDKVSQ